MGKTIKQLADELGVSKQAVWQRVKRTKHLAGMLDAHSRTVNGRIYIDEDLEQNIKALYSSLCVDETSVNNERNVDETSVSVGETTVNTEADVCETASGVDETSVNMAESKLLDTLQQTVSMLQQQLLAKDKQIDELTAMLKVSQEQQSTLASALTAAQALHAGTIQERLTEHSGTAEDIAEDIGTDQGREQASAEKKVGLFAKIFGKKKG